MLWPLQLVPPAGIVSFVVENIATVRLIVDGADDCTQRSRQRADYAVKFHIFYIILHLPVSVVRQSFGLKTNSLSAHRLR